MTSSALSQRLLDEYAEAREALPAGVVGAERRHEAIQALSAQGLPMTREENWRYANLRPLERARFVPAAAAASVAISGPPGAADVPPILEGLARYTFVDGRFAPQLSRPAQVPGLTVRHLHQSAGSRGAGATSASARLPRALPATGHFPEGRLALLNEAFATDGAAIDVSAAAGEPARVELLFIAVADAEAGASYPRVQVTLEPNGRLVLIERHLGAGALRWGASHPLPSAAGRGTRHLDRHAVRHARGGGSLQSLLHPNGRPFGTLDDLRGDGRRRFAAFLLGGRTR